MFQTVFKTKDPDLLFKESNQDLNFMAVDLLRSYKVFYLKSLQFLFAVA